MISSSPKFRRSRLSRAFTLVEVLIAMSLGSIIIAGVFSAFLMMVRSGVRLSSYATMETETRRAFERLGIDARMANNFTSTIVGGVITSFTLTIPTQDLTNQTQVTYGYDTSDSTNKKLYYVPGAVASETNGRVVLVNNVTGLTFLRYDGSSNLIPASVTSDATIKHIQISISVSRSGVSTQDRSIVAATQVIRSSAFTIRNISI
jgi:prepilin-type N-terminal cleavage/methylation domain-containing protein